MAFVLYAHNGENLKINNRLKENICDNINYPLTMKRGGDGDAFEWNLSASAKSKHPSKHRCFNIFYIFWPVFCTLNIIQGKIKNNNNNFYIFEFF